MLIEPVMILIRLVMALCNFLGGFVISCRTPSMRNRTRNRFSSGSRWMSLARILWASSRSIETILMIGASPVSASALARRRAVAELDLFRAKGLLEAAYRLIGGAIILDQGGLDLRRRRADEIDVPLDQMPDGVKGSRNRAGCSWP